MDIWTSIGKIPLSNLSIECQQVVIVRKQCVLGPPLLIFFPSGSADLVKGAYL